MNKEWRGSCTSIEDALTELRNPKVIEAKGTESKRWQVNYDYILARVQMEYAYLYEYQYMLGSMPRSSRRAIRNCTAAGSWWRSRICKATPPARRRPRKCAETVGKDHQGQRRFSLGSVGQA